MNDPTDPLASAKLVSTLCAKLRASYIFPEIAEQICANLLKHLLAGDYADLDEGELLALALTIHLQEVNHDEHLWVRWHADPLPDEDDQLRLNPEWQAQRRLEAAQDNFGVHQVERLPGNVGYLDLRYLHRPEWGGETVTAALQCLTNTQALILDLRHCTGGYPGMAALICSHVLPPPPRLIASIYWRDEDAVQEFWTQETSLGSNYADKPLFVLISKETFSAGELLAHVLGSQGRATLIGEQTDGGAHPGASYRLAPHFELFLPIGRTIDPQTGGDWEGVGITPDVVVLESYQEQTTAHKLALQAILEHALPPVNDFEVQYLDEVRGLLVRM